MIILIVCVGIFQVDERCVEAAAGPNKWRDFQSARPVAAPGVGQAATLPATDHVLGLCLYQEMQLLEQM